MLKHFPFGLKSCVNTDILKVLELKIIGDNFCKPDPKSNHHKGDVQDPPWKHKARAPDPPQRRGGGGSGEVQ